MATLDEIFVKEFNKARNSVSTSKTIYDLGLEPKGLPKQDFFQVKGITIDYYSKLNNLSVMLAPRGTKLERRLVKAHGEGYRLDSKGNVRTQEVKLPKGSIAVISNTPIGVPTNFSHEGFEYVDFYEVGGSRRYIYIIPKQYLYKIHFNALAISSKSMKSYSGISIKTWGLGVLHLCIVPYKVNRTYASTIILRAKGSLDFSKEVGEVLDYLKSIGIISELPLYLTEEGENVAISEVNPAYNPMEYIPVDLVPLSNVSDVDLEAMLNV